MSAADTFRTSFTKRSLKEIYLTDVQYNSGPGIDGVSIARFAKHLDEHIDTINRKVLSGTYRFSQYKEKLILRGAQRPPRVISVPTIRDKIVHKALYRVLLSSFSDRIPSLHEIVDRVSIAYRSDKYDKHLRFDVQNFYPSIDHNKLFKLIKSRIRKKEILFLLESSIVQKTVPKPEGRNKGKSHRGIPQGLVFSNILANVYMSNLDKTWGRRSVKFKYFRYVDDILVLCQSSMVKKISKGISSDCNNLDLDLHGDSVDSKTSAGSLMDEFVYLGYRFNNSKVSISQKSLMHLRQSIIRILTHHKYSKKPNVGILIWNINLRITGCFFNRTKYGWLFFYSQTNDKGLLYSLDGFVKKQLERFGIDPGGHKLKRFVKTYYEIVKNSRNTTYIPNFDSVGTSQKRKILREVFQLNSPLRTLDEIDYEFKKRIFKTVKSLEKDLASTS